MNIAFAAQNNLSELSRLDTHVSENELCRSIGCRRVLVASEGEETTGWLRYNLFWDNTPFLNMLFIKERFRGKGYGSELVRAWEREMKAAGYTHVMTSSQSEESAQHFFVGLGYRAVGGFLSAGEGYELLFRKTL